MKRAHENEVKVTIEFTYTTRWAETSDLQQTREHIEEVIAPSLLRTGLDISSYRIKLESGI